MLPLPEWVDPDAWSGFCEMRKAMKKVPFTDRAQRLVLKTLYELRAAGHDANACLDQSTLNGWRDVFPLRNKSIVDLNPKEDKTLEQMKIHAATARAMPQQIREQLKQIKRIK